MSLLTTLLISLLTIALSGVVSSYVTFRLASTRADRDFQLQKIEELVTCLHRFSEEYAVLGFAQTRALTDHKLDTLKDVLSHFGKFTATDVSKVQTIVTIYFPRLRPAYREFHSHWKFTTTFFAKAFRESRQEPGSSEEVAKQARDTILKLLALRDKLTAKAFEEAAAVRNPRFLYAVRDFVRDQIG